MLHRVGQRLADQEVRGTLDLRREPPSVQGPVGLNGDAERKPSRAGLDRLQETAIGQHRRMDAARQLAQLLQRLPCLVLPPGAGGYLLSAILHDWNDGGAIAILRRCAEAAGREAPVLVVEKIGAEGDALRTEMDLRMLVYFGGRERGVDELGMLAADAGLRIASVHPAGTLAIVELRSMRS